MKYVVVSDKLDYVTNTKAMSFHFANTGCNRIWLFNNKGNLLYKATKSGVVIDKQIVNDDIIRYPILKFAEKLPGSYTNNVFDWYEGNAEKKYNKKLI